MHMNKFILQFYLHSLFHSMLLLGLSGSPVFAQSHASTVAGAAVNYWTQGVVIATTKQFDLAIQGSGFFVLEKANGERVFARYGEMHLGSDGYLIHTSSGHKVLGFKQDQLVSINLAEHTEDDDTAHARGLKSFRIELNGDIAAIYENGHSHVVYSIALAQFNNSSRFKKIGQHLLIANELTGTPEIGRPLKNGRGSIYASTLEDLDDHMYRMNLMYVDVDRISAERNQRKMAFEQWVQQKTLFYAFDLKLTRSQFEALSEISRVAGEKIKKVNNDFATTDPRYGNAIRIITEDENAKALAILGLNNFQMTENFRKTFNDHVLANFGVEMNFTGF